MTYIHTHYGERTQAHQWYHSSHANRYIYLLFYFQMSSNNAYQICLVCREESSPEKPHQFNYGAICCLGCRAFFRRSNQKDSKTYTCKAGKNHQFSTIFIFTSLRSINLVPSLSLFSLIVFSLSLSLPQCICHISLSSVLLYLYLCNSLFFSRSVHFNFSLFAFFYLSLFLFLTSQDNFSLKHVHFRKCYHLFCRWQM